MSKFNKHTSKQPQSGVAASFQSDADWNQRTVDSKPITIHLFWGEVNWDQVGDAILIEKGKLNIPTSLYQMLGFNNPELEVPTQSGEAVQIPAMTSGYKIRAMHIFSDIVNPILKFHGAGSDNNKFVLPNCQHIDRKLLLTLLRESFIIKYVIVDWPSDAPATPQQLEKVVEKLATTHQEKPKQKGKAKRKPLPIDENGEITGSVIPPVEELTPEQQAAQDELAAKKANS